MKNDSIIDEDVSPAIPSGVTFKSPWKKECKQKVSPSAVRNK